MKIIITESKIDNLIERLLAENNYSLTLEVYNWYLGSPTAGVFFWFRHKIIDDFNLVRTVRFRIKNNKVYYQYTHDLFTNIIPEFRYIPMNVVTDYFMKKGKEYLENLIEEKLSEINQKEQIKENSDTKIQKILFTIFDKLFDNYDIYVDNEIYTKWYRKDIKNWTDENMSIHKNWWGKLWFEDCDIYNELLSYSRLFSIDVNTLKDHLVRYLNQRYEHEFSQTNPIKSINGVNCEEW